MSRRMQVDLRGRNDAIVEYYTQSKTLQETGDHFGLTRERVRQILKEYYPEKIRKRGDEGWIHVRGRGGKSRRLTNAQKRKRVADFKWSQKEVDFIVANYRRGMSARKIGKALGKTRNQIIGKARRLKEVGLIKEQSQ